jgi:predicted transglutaminase-like cysteine proteinase
MSPVLAPMQWTRYALDNPAMAVPHEGAILLADDLETVNLEVNRGIKPAPGMPAIDLGWVSWRSPGWCGDYAVTKRELLLRMGWPSRALLLAEVLTGEGEHHAVLVANGRVMDCRNDQLREPAKTGYKWVRQQSPDNPNFWTAA